MATIGHGCAMKDWLWLSIQSATKQIDGDIPTLTIFVYMKPYPSMTQQASCPGMLRPLTTNLKLDMLILY